MTLKFISFLAARSATLKYTPWKFQNFASLFINFFFSFSSFQIIKRYRNYHSFLTLIQFQIKLRIESFSANRFAGEKKNKRNRFSTRIGRSSSKCRLPSHRDGQKRLFIIFIWFLFFFPIPSLLLSDFKFSLKKRRNFLRYSFPFRFYNFYRLIDRRSISL